MEVYLYCELEKFVKMECAMPASWMDWMATRSQQLAMEGWTKIDTERDQELGARDAAPLLQDLLRLVSVSYTTEKYAFLGTCGHLPGDKEMREKLVDKTVERKLNNNPHYSATKELIALLKAQQVQGGKVMVAAA